MTMHHFLSSLFAVGSDVVCFQSTSGGRNLSSPLPTYQQRLALVRDLGDSNCGWDANGVPSIALPSQSGSLAESAGWLSSSMVRQRADAAKS